MGCLHYCTFLEEFTGETPDILEYLNFEFYGCCWYNNNDGLGETKLVKWMGVYHRVGILMSYWLLTYNGMVVSRMTISRVTNLEAQTYKNKSRIVVFDKAIQKCLNNKAQVIVEGGKGKLEDWSEHQFDRDPDFQEDFSHIVSNEEVADD